MLSKFDTYRKEGDLNHVFYSLYSTFCLFSLSVGRKKVVNFLNYSIVEKHSETLPENKMKIYKMKEKKHIKIFPPKLFGGKRNIHNHCNV